MVGREVDEHGGNGHGDRDGDGDAERGDGEGDEVGGRGEDEPMSDIEHVPCEDDPREWSDGKKNLVLAMMTTAVVSIHLLRPLSLSIRMYPRPYRSLSSSGVGCEVVPGLDMR